MDAVKVAPVEPIQVAIVSTNSENHEDGVTAVTPGHLPNLVVKVVTPLMAVLVRFINQFLTTLGGLLAVGVTTKGTLPSDDFMHLVVTCASLSVATAGVGAIKDCVTIFSKLEQKFPLGTGSI